MPTHDPQHPQPHRRYAANDYSTAAIQARDAWREDRTCFACGHEIPFGPICYVHIEQYERKMHPACVSAYERALEFHVSQHQHATVLGTPALFGPKRWDALADEKRYILVRSILDLLTELSAPRY